jgi:hypothetical protein
MGRASLRDEIFKQQDESGKYFLLYDGYRPSADTGRFGND